MIPDHAMVQDGDIGMDDAVGPDSHMMTDEDIRVYIRAGADDSRQCRRIERFFGNI